MTDFGFIRVASCTPTVRVADCSYNIREIKKMIDKASESSVSVICFPELCVTGYTCGDLFFQDRLKTSALESLEWLLANNLSETISIIGMPLEINNSMFNCAVVIYHSQILGVVPKTFIPNYKEFYEKRWFAGSESLHSQEMTLLGRSVPVGKDLLFHINPALNCECCFGIEICEDLWSPIPPSTSLSLMGAHLIFNLSASNDLISKHNYLKNLLSQQSARCLCGYVYASCGYGESTQDVVFGGKSLIYENGALQKESKRFELESQLIISDLDLERLVHERSVNTSYRDAVRQLSSKVTNQVIHVKQSTNQQTNFQDIFYRNINPHPFVPSGPTLDERCDEIFNIQIMALAKRVSHVNAKSLVVGVSGGLDSTLALLVCVKTMDVLQRDRKDIIGITMPGFGTTGRTYNNSIKLMELLGISQRDISIKDACIQHFKDIGHDVSNHDVTYENCQARERTQILMDVANQTNGFVVGTGDLSELALGWATYNADHMSMYGVNCSIPKTLVKHLIAWVCENSIDKSVHDVLKDIIDTPISPELIPADENDQITQKTEDLVGPYELHDFFLYHFMRFGYTPSKIYFMAKKAFDKESNKNNPGYGGHPSYYSSATINKWLNVFCRRFFTQQFKRSCLPDGPKVGSVSLSPRGDWRMPSDACFNEWVQDCSLNEK